MSDNIVKFYPNNAANNPDYVLEQAVGVYKDVLIVGYNQEDELEVRGNMNLTKAELNWMLDWVKFNLVSGVYDEEE